MGLFGRRRKESTSPGTPAPAPNRSDGRAESPAAEIRRQVEAGDLRGAITRLQEAPVSDAEFAELVARIGHSVELSDLTRAGQTAEARPQDHEALYQLGYELIEVGLPELAVRPLTTAYRQGFDARVVFELVAALESLDRHGDAAWLLRTHEAELPPGGTQYLLVHNLLQSGAVDEALRRGVDVTDVQGLGDAPGALRSRLARAWDRRAATSSLHPQDLRGWQFVLDATVLLTLSPWGIDTMNGRHGFTSDSFAQCAVALERLRLVLDTAGVRPHHVALLPDRDSRILGLAVAQSLGLPSRAYTPGDPGGLVVAYRLETLAAELQEALVKRAPGEILFEHVGQWVTPARVVPDVVTFLAQAVTAPWGAQLTFGNGPTPVAHEVPADDSPAEDLAARICATPPEDFAGDADAVPDGPDVLARFVREARQSWPDADRRLRRPGNGPVRSARFL
ncbi:hypothetical protein [Granulicoccus sp. GXG6511]|uniref:hypothetical protein n=1 Tax=Granulicoccus sp. GXG6511 TaxID=3381351 RepID=UPI003D7EF6DF